MFRLSFFKLGNKPVFYTIFFSFLTFSMKAQENLVPNPSFEEYYSCPTGPDNGDGQLEKAKDWYKPNYATSDYINACSSLSSRVSVPSNFVGYQDTFEGFGYVGLVIYSEHFSAQAEYIQCKLKEALKPCFTYYFSMRVSLADFSSFSTSTIGMRVDKVPIKKESNALDQYDGFELPCNICSEVYITDTVNWIKVSGEFIAEGGEEYLTIGRFFDTVLYSNENFPVTPIQCNSCFLIDNISYYYIDSIQLFESSISYNVQEISNVLTANDDGINDYWNPTNTCFSDWKCIIVNRWGEQVYSFVHTDNGWNGNDMNGKKLAEGTYFYIIEENNKKKTGFIQLIR